MGIDSTVFGLDIPNGTVLNVGDVYPMKVIYGSETVRAGYGSGTLLEMISGVISGGTGGVFRVHVKNSNWIDESISFAGSFNGVSAFDERSGMVQNGAYAVVEPNTKWNVYAEVVQGGTTTGDNSLITKLDIQFDSVSAIVDPNTIVGTPASMVYDFPNATIHGAGTITTTAHFDAINVNDFKAGYKYCLQEIETYSGARFGMMAFEGSAGMKGLSRVVFLNMDPSAIRQRIRFSPVLEQGPMTIKTLFMNATAGTGTVVSVVDYVKKQA